MLQAIPNTPAGSPPPPPGLAGGSRAPPPRGRAGGPSHGLGLVGSRGAAGPPRGQAGREDCRRRESVRADSEDGRGDV